MKASKSFAFLIALACLTLSVAVFPRTAAGQDEGWLVMRADYGFRSQRVDVTGILRELLSQGGVNGRIAVDNQTMGGDPSVGNDKTLRIFVKNNQGEEREFDYVEDNFVPVAIFTIRRDEDGRGRGGWRDNLSIVRAFYGVQGKTANVTGLVQSMVRGGSVNANVNNLSMGGDPAVGAEKVLIVIYKYGGQEQATVVSENNTLSIP
jgi:hypothetical protein